jgi:hypothetical protein
VYEFRSLTISNTEVTALHGAQVGVVTGSEATGDINSKHMEGREMEMGEEASEGVEEHSGV